MLTGLNMLLGFNFQKAKLNINMTNKRPYPQSSNAGLNHWIPGRVYMHCVCHRDEADQGIYIYIF